MPEKLLNPQVFKSFVQQYRDRYGESRMSNDSVKMWYEKLHWMDDGEFKKTTERLVGTKDRAFGWQSVVEMSDLMFPEESEQHKLDREWKSNNLTYGSKDVRSKMLNKMAELIGGKAGKIRKGSVQNENWREEFADFTIELLGKETAIKNARGCTNVFPEFLKIVVNRVDKGSTLGTPL